MEHILNKELTESFGLTPWELKNQKVISYDSKDNVKLSYIMHGDIHAWKLSKGGKTLGIEVLIDLDSQRKFLNKYL